MVAREGGGGYSDKSASSHPVTEEDCLPATTIPMDLISEEILPRLPVKTLLRLRSVCKSWNAIISCPQFAKKQFQLASSSSSSSRDHLILFDPNIPSTGHFRDSGINPKWQLGKSLKVLCGSCHGMLCVGNSSSLRTNQPIVLNPSTGKFKMLPWIDHGHGHGNDLVVCYGFGYDHLSDTYKVVSLLIDYLSRCVSYVHVHSLGTNSWREIKDFPRCFCSPHVSGKFLSGTLNWLAFDETNFSTVIISLNLGTEKFEKFQPLLPTPGSGEVNNKRIEYFLSLEVLKDSLCIIIRTCTHQSVTNDVWVMKEFGNNESWTKLYSFPDGGSQFSFIYDDGEKIMLLSSGYLTVCNLKSRTSKTLRDQLASYSSVVESLISPCF